MATYIPKTDKRDTSKGKTPNKAIRQPQNPAPKKPLGNYNKQIMRRPQGR